MIEPLLATFGWLASLPEASEAIASKGVALGWADAGDLERSHSPYIFHVSDTLAEYGNGKRIFFHDDDGVQSVSGAIGAYYKHHRSLGHPAADQEAVPSSPFGTHGVRQPSSRRASTHRSAALSP